MISSLKISGFKSIEKEILILKPLTILTGLNSAGKSTVIQSILMLSSANSTDHTAIIHSFMKDYSGFNTSRNRYINSKEIQITAECNNCNNLEIRYSNDNYFQNTIVDPSPLDFDKNLFYISANRIGQEELANFDEKIKFGTNGEYVFGFFEQNKSNTISKEVTTAEADSFTLDSQVSYWLKHILDIDLRINTEQITSTNVKVSFNSDGLENISPFNLGAGNSYLAKIIIMALSCSPGNILIIENPEIHLHPKSQSMLADFLAFISSNDIQLVIETHSEHIINKMRFHIYKGGSVPEDTIIHYKPSAREPFAQLNINKNGHFTDESNNEISFPEGFFDSTLTELLEMM